MIVPSLNIADSLLKNHFLSGTPSPTQLDSIPSPLLFLGLRAVLSFPFRSHTKNPQNAFFFSSATPISFCPPFLSFFFSALIFFRIRAADNGVLKCSRFSLALLHVYLSFLSFVLSAMCLCGPKKSSSLDLHPFFPDHYETSSRGKCRASSLWNEKTPLSKGRYGIPPFSLPFWYRLHPLILPPLAKRWPPSQEFLFPPQSNPLCCWPCRRPLFPLRELILLALLLSLLKVF